ncbi:phosphotransferase family protein [Shewanella donghaensis]|uniref:phosphotransferase family protein n=1 Tax=Shewanella donghaensis TaxID=238836 RepID=UPI00118441C8|nr:phosphotransferase [Shewanella donghaensis]
MTSSTSPAHQQTVHQQTLLSKSQLQPLQTWQDSDWPSTANTWIKSALVSHNVELVGDLMEVKCWSLGHVLKQATAQGDFFFKATAQLPLFSNEPKLCEKLSQLFPKQSAKIIAIDETKKWMLTEDFGAAYEDTVTNPIPLIAWADAFASFAQLQINSVNHIQDLASSGCLVRDIQDLPQQLTSIFNDDNILARLPDSILRTPQQYQVILTSLETAITALKQFKLPDTLVHSDLHIENIAKVEDEFIFFDWSDGCISHPFIDGTYLFRMEPSSEKQAVINAYLSQWHSFHSIGQLNQAWNIAEVVCYAHQAVSYSQMINRLPQQNIEDLQVAFENAIRRFCDKAM